MFANEKPSFWIGAAKGFVYGNLVGSVFLTAFAVGIHKPIFACLGAAIFGISMLCVSKL